MKSLLRAIFLAFTLGLAVGVYLMRQQQRHERAVAEAAEENYWQQQNERLDHEWGQPEAEALINQFLED